MKQLTIGLATSNGHTYCGPTHTAPPGIIKPLTIYVADPALVLESMQDIFARGHIRGPYFDNRFIKPERIAAQITTPMALGVAA